MTSLSVSVLDSPLLSATQFIFVARYREDHFSVSSEDLIAYFSSWTTAKEFICAELKNYLVDPFSNSKFHSIILDELALLEAGACHHSSMLEKKRGITWSIAQVILRP